VLVGGRFRLEKPIAKGGMGEVWAGEHRATGMRVALKMLLPEVSRNLEVVQRFKREAVLLGRVRSDRVARMVDFLFDSKCGAVLVTEFIEGSPLAEVQKSAPTSVEDAVELGIEIARALRDLHRENIVHRDLKPGNVILQSLPDGSRRAVLVDLGVSRLLSPAAEENTEALTNITKTQIVLGTIGYMAPEQILDPREVTASADLYGLGAMLFRMVGGHQVFDGKSVVEHMRAKLDEEAPRLRTGRTDALARGFEAFVARALQRVPAHRHESADEMITALSALRGDPITSSGVVLRPRVETSRRRRTGSGLMVLAASVTLAGFVALGVAHRARTATALPSPQAAADPAPNEVLTSTPGDGPQTGTDQTACTSGDATHEVTPQPSKDLQAATPLHADARPPLTQRERDAALMRAIKRAVQEEAYMTLPLPPLSLAAAGTLQGPQ
jgi:serine/threonine protein kinase